MAIRHLAAFCTGLLLSVLSFADGAVAIMQYHNVSVQTPRSTSVSLEELKGHIKWLKDNQFQIKALDVALNELKNNEYSNQDRIATITFDDSHISVCLTAWPYLRDAGIPFTLFVNTDPVARGFKSQCSIEQLQEMKKSGLVILANHSKSHAHMANINDYPNEQAWRDFVNNEIDEAQAFLEKHFGKTAKIFAYPYGEYNTKLQQILEKKGYIAFGQQSGAVGIHSDFLGLPRFPLSGTYANLKTLPDKMRSLAFPVVASYSSDNPIKTGSDNNPPVLTLQLKNRIDSRVNCFLATGSPITVEQTSDTITITHKAPLNAGRQRYNCTAQSGIPGRYYWYSHQWLMED